MAHYGSRSGNSVKRFPMGRVLGRSTDHNIIIVFALYRTHVK
ncbi:hypothetical protein [Leptospira noguchii]|nr:hypothetical protein [Leptospira noguchii]